MSPIVAEFLAFLTSKLAQEINPTALVSTVVNYEESHPFQNFLPAIIANGPAIFTDPATEPIIVALLQALAVKAATRGK